MYPLIKHYIVLWCEKNYLSNNDIVQCYYVYDVSTQLLERLNLYINVKYIRIRISKVGFTNKQNKHWIYGHKKYSAYKSFDI